MAIEKGDLLRLVANKVIPVAAITDNLTLYAIAEQAHPARAAGVVDNITVALTNPLSTWEFDLDVSTVITFGDNLQIFAAQRLRKGDIDSVARAVEAGTLTTVKCVFKLPVLFLGDLT